MQILSEVLGYGIIAILAVIIIMAFIKILTSGIDALTKYDD
jgi:hypothetical protein